MKFTLIISLCSFINNQCFPPAEIKQPFNSWKECVVFALDISQKLIIAQEDAFINDNKVAVQFVCTEVGEI
jgi:hypothetical protein